MAQNQILEEMQGVQWLRIRFWKNCKACNGSESDSGGIVRSAMAQNRVLRELQGMQRLKTGFYEKCRVCNGPETKSGGRDRIPHPRYIQACVMKTLRYAAKPPRFYLSSDSALAMRRMASVMASSEAA